MIKIHISDLPTPKLTLTCIDYTYKFAIYILAVLVTKLVGLNQITVYYGINLNLRIFKFERYRYETVSVKRLAATTPVEKAFANHLMNICV